VNLRFVFSLLASLIVLHGTSRASTADAEKRLQTAVDDVLAAANRAPNSAALASSLRPILLKYISFDAMTRRAVGPGWRQFTPEQKKQASQLFTTLIIRSYSSKFTPGEKPLITFKTATTPAPGRVEIPTVLTYQGSKYGVTYRMEADEDWRITDVVIEGVSLVANYRTQFDAEFKKDGANAVIGALIQAEAAP
jgi:phospholipid transport system substrate-binding protein